MVSVQELGFEHHMAGGMYPIMDGKQILLSSASAHADGNGSSTWAWKTEL